MYGIDFATLEEDEFDSLLGQSSGASVIFATTGGVMRRQQGQTVEWITGQELENVEFNQLRGLAGIRDICTGWGFKSHIRYSSWSG